MFRVRKAFAASGLAFLLLLVFAGSALAQEAAAAAGDTANWTVIGRALAAALAIGIAAAGGGLGQGRAAAGALEGIARNPSAQPKIFNALILSLALIESLVIYALIIAFIVMP